MNPVFVNEYLAKFISTGDEDAFHSLIEEKDEAVDAIINMLKTNYSLDMFSRAMEVLKEIRTEKSFNLLCDLCLNNVMSCWRESVEALVYNNQVAAERVLFEQLDKLSGEELILKKNILNEIYEKMNLKNDPCRANE